MVICVASFISREALHLTQYPLANAAPPDGLSSPRTLALWLGRAKQALERALSRSDLVVATGGLGPTEDDLTREAIAAALGETPAVDPALEADLVAWFSGRGIVMPDRNRKQAWLIPSARALPNPNGTAPGWDVQKDGKRIIAMPGGPREMTRMWEVEVEPTLGEGSILRSRPLKLLGIGES